MKTRIILIALLLLSFVALSFQTSQAQCSEQAILRASDAQRDDFLGYRVAICGDVAVVGAHGEDTGGSASGAAYVFRRDNAGDWIEEQKLVASNPAASDWFGISVAISGDIIAVGAYGTDSMGSETGAVYVFRCNGSSWVQDAIITAVNGAAGDRFGFWVSVGDDVLVVGAPLDDNALGVNAGSVYVYRDQGILGWSFEQNILASDGAGSDQFGISVDVDIASDSDQLIVVGAWGDDDVGLSSGSAYVYRFNGSTWDEEQKIVASDGVANGVFGFSVSVTAATQLSNNRVLVGAYDFNGSTSGQAYIFEHNGGSWFEKQILSNNGNPGDYFGYSTDIDGDVALVGAYGLDDGSRSAYGAAYVYRRINDNWLLDQRLEASTGWDSDFYAFALSLDGDFAICGAYGDDDFGSRSGTAWVHQVRSALVLEANAQTYTAGDRFELDTFCGREATPALFVVIDRRGVPVFLPLPPQNFGPDEHARLIITSLPSGIPPGQITFLSFKLGLTGIVTSNPVTVTFQ